MHVTVAVRACLLLFDQPGAFELARRGEGCPRHRMLMQLQIACNERGRQPEAASETEPDVGGRGPVYGQPSGEGCLIVLTP